MTRTTADVTGTTEVAHIAAARDPYEVVPQVLDLVRLTGAIFFRSDFRSPWSYTSPPTRELVGALPPGRGSLVMFHIVAEGHCWVALRDGVRHEVAQGDVVVLPYGDAHAFGSSEPAEPVSIASLLPPSPWLEFPHIEYGGGGDVTLVVCGYLMGDAVLFDPVLRALPALFVVHPPPGPAATWVSASVEYALAASAAPARPATWTHQRLPELLFTEVLRLYLEQSQDAQLTGWLAALRDPRGRARALAAPSRSRPRLVRGRAGSRCGGLGDGAVGALPASPGQAAHPVSHGVAPQPGLGAAANHERQRRRDRRPGRLRVRGCVQPGVQAGPGQRARALASPRPLTRRGSTGC